MENIDPNTLTRIEYVFPPHKQYSFGWNEPITLVETDPQVIRAGLDDGFDGPTMYLMGKKLYQYAFLLGQSGYTYPVETIAELDGRLDVLNFNEPDLRDAYHEAFHQMGLGLRPGATVKRAKSE